MPENTKAQGSELSDGLGGDPFFVKGYKFTRIDDFEIRMESPKGEAWRLRYADDNAGFAKFVWDFAVAMANA